MIGTERESDVMVIRTMTQLEWARNVLEHAINATPTGKRRNLLTQVNMQMMLLEEEMKTALQVRVNEGEG